MRQYTTERLRINRESSLSMRSLAIVLILTLSACAEENGLQYNFCNARDSCDHVPPGQILVFGFGSTDEHHDAPKIAANYCDFGREILVSGTMLSCVKAESRSWNQELQAERAQRRPLSSFRKQEKPEDD